jgi:hypothetical protein
MSRITAAVSVVLALLVAAAVAQATLLGLLVLFTSVLRLDLVMELAGHYVQISAVGVVSFLQVGIRNAGTIGSFLLTLACGLGAAAYRYRRWRPVS